MDRYQRNVDGVATALRGPSINDVAWCVNRCGWVRGSAMFETVRRAAHRHVSRTGHSVHVTATTTFIYAPDPLPDYRRLLAELEE